MTINCGSEWHRWEPHIHAPGTIMNDQFGADAWEDYIIALEQAAPTIEAIAVTDYYITDTYEKVLQFKTDGRLPSVQLIFPNIELRLDVATKSGGFVNLHLFVSPDHSDHIAELQRFISRLTFSAYGDEFNCTKEDLIRLGKKADPSITEDKVALSYGANQFKVNFRSLRDTFNKSEWARKNVLVAVAGGSTDGTAGVREASDRVIREEIEAFADIIFAGNPGQREFWLGKKSLSASDICNRYGALKPCLHGSDAHRVDVVATPFGDRFSWLKGALKFDTLRQACIVPDGRAFVAECPPLSSISSQTISCIKIENADWIKTPNISLNLGLVAVIGARGSGKTALADIIAAGCDAISPMGWNPNNHIYSSFLARANGLVGSSTVEVKWGNNETVQRALNGSSIGGGLIYPRARYLSQQFVEELCSSNGASDGLVDEIERIIFEAHAYEDREGANKFSELRNYKTSRFRQAREREAEAIYNLSEAIGIETEKESSITPLILQISKKKTLIANYTQDLAKLVLKGTPEQQRRHTQLTTVANDLKSRIQNFTAQYRTFIAMKDEVQSMRRTGAPEMLRQMQMRFANSGLNNVAWNAFLLNYVGNVDQDLEGYIRWAEGEIAKLRGTTVPSISPNTPVFSDDADLSQLSLAPINAEITRLESLFSADQSVRNQYAALNNRIAEENQSLKKLENQLTNAQGASARKKGLQDERTKAYSRVFEAIISEQDVLARLYEPLMVRLSASSGTLGKLGFTVRRIADVEKWGDDAEHNLLDLRKTGDFQGRGSLAGVVKDFFKTVWETGAPNEIQSAMEDFIKEYWGKIIVHAPDYNTQQAEFRAWSKQFAQWLFSTEHISIRYEMNYEGTDIRKLSPGTRGIVLLLLYLALDDTDDRPLIIDQPEENLDPKSVFDELVPLFISAKTKRQIIIVTHNANLVINTDADQILIAKAGPNSATGLPPMSYISGGLEDKNIRDEVCKILEGGKAAFQERARRLRFSI